ncbi:putative triacylglycerol lipase [Helianthus annuus]|nr:putative triacylglycerol lipase [Helianthus annuus]KAJ0846605.1 putative triacylglycerol lipase [Helianthus annuus]
MDSDFGLLIYITCLMVLLHFQNFVVSDKPQVPCYFIFGDSLFDAGNNNQLDIKWKANYPPYGIDFPKGHIGRFTNGRTTADIIGMSLLALLIFTLIVMRQVLLIYGKMPLYMCFSHHFGKKIKRDFTSYQQFKRILLKSIYYT